MKIDNLKNLLPSMLLQLQWEEFFKTHDEDAQFLQVCYSSGAIHVKCALKNSPYRDRITVLAVAPASIITPDECLDVLNIASEKDAVPQLNRDKDKKYLKILPVHPDERFAILDHRFDSPTYKEEIDRFLKKFKEENE